MAVNLNTVHLKYAMCLNKSQFCLMKDICKDYNLSATTLVK